MFKVYLADDHAILREGLKAMMTNNTELMVAGESGTGRETIRDIDAGEYDLLVLDMVLPDMDGFDVLMRVKRSRPNLLVMILTLRIDETLAIRLLKSGAVGYAVKAMPPLQIIDAMRRVLRGERFLAPELAAMIASRVSTQQKGSLHERLSNREYTIFIKLASGLSITEIANELHIAPSTVSTHRTHILEKLELTSNADLVRYAVSLESPAYVSE
ncbi:MAG: response regulator transcription factor [Magnetococcales bacterium]|nr:response regulator transcription factor [Magnetococcales bacterium]